MAIAIRLFGLYLVILTVLAVGCTSAQQGTVSGPVGNKTVEELQIPDVYWGEPDGSAGLLVAYEWNAHEDFFEYVTPTPVVWSVRSDLEPNRVFLDRDEVPLSVSVWGYDSLGADGTPDVDAKLEYSCTTVDGTCEGDLSKSGYLAAVPTEASVRCLVVVQVEWESTEAGPEDPPVDRGSWGFRNQKFPACGKR